MDHAADCDTVPAWEGPHHLALACHSLDETIRFYVGALGMRVVADGEAPGGVKHAMVDAGDGSCLHFWELPDVEIFQLPPQRGASIPGALQHLSLRLPDREALESLQERLRAFGITTTGIFQQGPVQLLFFEDPDGTLLEATCWDVDATERAVDYEDERFFTDPTPVPAIEELRAGADPNGLWKRRQWVD